MGSTTSKCRAGMFLRVSTADQHLVNQHVVLEKVAVDRGLRITSTYSEHVSGTARDRPELDRMMRDARAGKLTHLVIWALDRLGRTMGSTFNTVLELDALGVKIISVQESWLDMEGPVRSLLVAVFAWVAGQEKARLVERVRIGMDRARREGQHLGRPRVDVDLDRLRDLRGRGFSVRAAAREMKLAPATVHRALIALEDVSQNPSSDRPLEMAESDPIGTVSKGRFQLAKKESLVGHDAAALRSGRTR
jgi:putative DNA-invertase from lambdoid prophage Rac